MNQNQKEEENKETKPPANSLGAKLFGGLGK